MPVNSIGFSTKLVYGFGTVAYGIKDNGFNFLLLIFYNQLLGLPAQLVGFAIMIALIIDGFVDPLIGHVSDRFHSRLGRRHPFMYASALPCALVYYLLWNPPSGLGTGALFWYLLLTAIVVRILIALYEVPSAALLAELTEDYDVRTSLVAYRFFFGYLGAVLMGVIALSVFLRPTAAQAVGLLNRAGYHGYSIAAALCMFGSILISTAGTHHYIPALRAPPPKRPFDLGRELREIRAALNNRPFLSMLACGVFSNMAFGLMATLSVYFYTYFWELSADQVSALLLSALISAGAALIVAPVITKRLDKKRGAIAAALITLVLAPVPVVLRLCGWFVSNSSPALMPILLIFTLVLGTMTVVSSALVTSMLADTVEENEIRTSQRTEGLYFAAAFFVQKCVSGLGIFAAGLILAWVKFPEGARPGLVAPPVLRHLALTYIPLLMVLLGISIFCITFYRIGRATHNSNLALLHAAQGNRDFTHNGGA
ncbi:MAG TPA: MFS transporter [Steroidobacteraceae bacterium]|nr:MFS transporter [Steroidobacteraceae bacterium]